MIHIIPINDLEEHEESTTCHCEPDIVQAEDGEIIVIHCAFDGREGVEAVNDILNNIEKL